MLHQPTIEKLMSMRLQGMVSALEEMEQQEAAADLSFEEKLALLVDRQYTWRQNLAFQQRLKRARLRGNACVEDIDYRTSRGLDKGVVRGLAQESAWVQRHENVFVVGPTGCGKSYLARRWRTRPAATATWCCMHGRRRFFAIFHWRAPTAVCAVYWGG
jgi:DNA replication protein DnaC